MTERKRRDLFAGAVSFDEYANKAAEGPKRLPRCRGRRVGKKDQHGLSEAEIQRSILDLLKLYRVPHWRVGVQGQIRWGKDGTGMLTPSASKGFPDLVAILPGGKLFGIEVKKPGGFVSTVQDSVLETMRNAGAVAIVATSVDDVKAVLAQHIPF